MPSAGTTSIKHRQFGRFSKVCLVETHSNKYFCNIRGRSCGRCSLRCDLDFLFSLQSLINKKWQKQERIVCREKVKRKVVFRDCAVVFLRSWQKSRGGFRCLSSTSPSWVHGDPYQILYDVNDLSTCCCCGRDVMQSNRHSESVPG